MKIPAVKTWVLTSVAGEKYEIDAPTRLLALMNFRTIYGFGIPIKTVSVKRK